MAGKVKRRLPQCRGVRNYVRMILFRAIRYLYLNMIICEHAESWKYFIYIPESGDDSFQTRSTWVAIPAFLTLALYFVPLPALFPFRDGRELPWPFCFSQWAWVTMAIFLFAMGVSYHGHFSFHFFPTTGSSYQHIFLFAMGWSYQHRFTHSNFSQVCAAWIDFIHSFRFLPYSFHLLPVEIPLL